MSSRKELLAYINPILFYYSLIYGVSKCIEFMFNTRSVWQMIWNKVMDVFGEDAGIYSIWIINSYSYLLYWTLGGLLFAMESFKVPKSLKNYKIQEKKIVEENQKTLYGVSVLHVNCSICNLLFFCLR